MVTVVHRPARAERGDELTVAILTFGPGNEAFDKFGHNAIWIHDEARGSDQVYNFGTYHFDSSDILLKFWQKRMKYWLSRRKGIESTIRSYKRQDRRIVAQVLELTGPQKAEMLQRLEENARPENREYAYDYYADNCTTRVRDAVDVVIGGALRESSRGPGSTYRQHTLRMSADYKPLYVVLHLVMGGEIDKPADQWAEMFLPEKLQEGLARARVRSADGSEVPLVKEERVLFEPKRPPPLTAPPRWAPWFLLVGSVVGGAMALLGWLAARRRGTLAGVGARVGLGALLSLLGFVIGFLGWFYVLTWAMTPHIMGAKNENIFHCAPWVIALLVVGVGVALGRTRWIRLALLLVASAAAFCALGLVLKVLPWFYQDNWQIIAFLFPFWAGTTFGLRELDRAARQQPVVAEPDIEATGKKKKTKAKRAPESEGEPSPAEPTAAE
jgi:hypothetical protein